MNKQDKTYDDKTAKRLAAIMQERIKGTFCDFLGMNVIKYQEGYCLTKSMIKPEFLNRIDETIVFRALNKTDMKQIVTLLCKELQKRAKNQMNIELIIRDSAKEYIVEKAYDRKYGARPLKRKIQDEIEDRLAEMVVSGDVASGDKVIVATKNKEIFLSKAQ